MKTMTYLALLAILSGLIYWQFFAYRAPQPYYNLIKKENNIEIREYPDLLLASVNVKGQQHEAITTGFKRLASYIFGGNQSQQKMRMTAPVLQSRNGSEWKIQFVMPSELSKKLLPIPDDKKIMFDHIKNTKFIVIEFSGSNSEINLKNHLDELNNYVSKNKLVTVGAPVYAFYNPPWILPLLRRNEIFLKLH